MDFFMNFSFQSIIWGVLTLLNSSAFTAQNVDSSTYFLNYDECVEAYNQKSNRDLVEKSLLDIAQDITNVRTSLKAIVFLRNNFFYSPKPHINEITKTLLIQIVEQLHVHTSTIHSLQSPYYRAILFLYGYKFPDEMSYAIDVLKKLLPTVHEKNVKMDILRKLWWAVEGCGYGQREFCRPHLHALATDFNNRDGHEFAVELLRKGNHEDEQFALKIINMNNSH
jgi:hypothetical protein